jgi:hypothetical protein
MAKNDLRWRWDLAHNARCFQFHSHTEVAVILNQNETVQEPNSGHFLFPRRILDGGQSESDLRTHITLESWSVRSINWSEPRWTKYIAGADRPPFR